MTDTNTNQAAVIVGATAKAAKLLGIKSTDPIKVFGEAKKKLHNATLDIGTKRNIRALCALLVLELTDTKREEHRKLAKEAAWGQVVLQHDLSVCVTVTDSNGKDIPCLGDLDRLSLTMLYNLRLAGAVSGKSSAQTIKAGVWRKNVEYYYSSEMSAPLANWLINPLRAIESYKNSLLALEGKIKTSGLTTVDAELNATKQAINLLPFVQDQLSTCELWLAGIQAMTTLDGKTLQERHDLKELMAIQQAHVEASSQKRSVAKALTDKMQKIETFRPLFNAQDEKDFEEKKELANDMANELLNTELVTS